MKKCTKCGKELSDEALFCLRCGESQVGPKGDPLLGQVVVDRYLIKELCGEGGSGTVYRARHTGLQQTVAVKFLHHHLSHDETAIERFRREATTVASIDNEHIIEVKDFGRADDGRFFMVMEFLKGETLKELLLKESPLDPLLAKDVALQVGEALMEAHGMGYIHRDLRPGNIFLATRKGKPNFVKLMDFGLSKLILPGDIQPQSTIGITFGDPVYISPEQARGEKVDRRSDIYSLGVVLYEILTGSAPFSGKEILQLLDQHLEAMPELPSKRRPGLPSAVDAVLMKALAKDADSRHVTVLNFNEAVEKAFAGFTGLPEKTAEPAASEGASEGAAQPEPSEVEEKKKPKKTASYEVQEPKAASGAASGAATGEAPAAPAEDIPPGETLQGAVPGPVKVPDEKPGEPEPAAITKEYPKPSKPATQPPPSGAKPDKDEVKKAEAEKAEPDKEEAEKAEAEKAEPDKDEAEKAEPDKDEAEKAEPDKAEPDKAKPDKEEAEKAEAEKAEPEKAAEKEAKDGKEKPAEKKAKVARKKSGPAKVIRDPTVSQMWYAEGDEAQKALKEMVAADRAAEDTAPALPAMYDKMDKGPSGGHKIVLVLAGGLAVALVVALIVLGVRSKKKDADLDDEEVATSKGRSDAAEVKTSPGPDASAPSAAADAEPPKKAGPDAAPARTRPLVLDPDGLIIKGPDTRGGRRPRGRRPRDGRTGPGRLPRDPRDPTLTGPSPKQLAKEQVKLGRAALRRGALGQAASHFQKARKLNPSSGSALAGLGEVAFERGKHGTAAKHLRSALRYSSSIRIMVMLGNSYFKLGRYRSAERMFLKVLKRRPSHAEAKRNLQVVRRRLARTSMSP